MLEIGEHSAYASKYTYTTDKFGNCTAQTADPVNMFFYDMGYTQNVDRKLYSKGWEDTNWGDNQCAFASSTQHFYIEGLQKQTIQMHKGYGYWGTLLERDHMRMWEGGWSYGAEGWWSIGAVHHEYTSAWEFDHCLSPYNPDGSSFDLAEYHVWNDALGNYGHFFWNAYNGGWWQSCGNSVWNDGIGVGVDLPSNMLSPGEGVAPGQYRESQDFRFWLIYQTDGNLVLYQRGVGAIWASGTITSPAFAIMQTDGNFVLYNPSWVPYWATNTWGNPGAWLIVQNDGNVVIYNTNWAPIWATNTCCR